MSAASIYSRCIIGSKYIDEISELTSLGIECITVNESPNLENEINSHADILCCRASDNIIFADNSIAGELSKNIKDYSIIPVNDIKSPYPDDVKLNVAFLGNNIICNSKYIAKEISDFCNLNNIQIIKTKQGYTKCNLCVLNEKAVITEDNGLAYLLKNYQSDVLKIQPGYVELSEKHYGFIGGASARIADDTIYFSGNISVHPDYDKIIDFLNNYGYKPFFNKNRKLTDFGGLIML